MKSSELTLKERRLSLVDHLAHIATEALFRKWDDRFDSSCGVRYEMRRYLTEVLRRQGLIGNDETSEFYEARLLVRLHIVAASVIDPREAKTASRRDDFKAARSRLGRLEKARAEISNVLAEDAAAPTHASILAFIPAHVRTDLSKSHREFWMPLLGAKSFRQKLLGNGPRHRPSHPTWTSLISGLGRIYAEIRGQPAETAFLAGIKAMNSALPNYARAASDEAIRKRVERVRRMALDITA